jgi:hypothetical protein
MDNNNKILVNELTKLLIGGNAHVSFEDAIKGLPENLRGIKPDKLPYSIWQLVEHIRIAQWDMLRFCMDPNHQSPKWPDEYWPSETAPADDSAWNDSIEQISNDRDEFIGILEHSDVYSQIPGASGQTILLEALQIADHTSYHVAEIIAIRRLLDAWK